uniref:ARAD1D10714p n=1 Tax=Blastobotrys adeninivorans TaxID=409370 RepID=A0A060T9C2_BLAAD
MASTAVNGSTVIVDGARSESPENPESPQATVLDSVSGPEWIEMSMRDIGQSIYDHQPLSREKRDLKLKAIDTAYQLNDVNLLAELARSREGLITNSARAKVWTLFAEKYGNITEPEQDWHQLAPHSEEEQIKLDVERAFVFYPAEGDKEQLKEKLFDLIRSVFRRHPQLSYYQGYHDIAQVILLVFDGIVENAVPVLEAVTMSFLRDYMLPSLDATLDQLELVPVILTLADPYIGQLVRGKPFYALSSVLTFLAHHIKSFDEICVVFDHVIASNDMSFVLYLYVAIIISQRDEIKELGGDVDIIHSYLTNVGEQEFNVFEVMARADELSRKYPISTLGETWDNISPHSVLKCKDNVFDKQLDEFEQAKVTEQKEKEKVKEREKEKQLEQEKTTTDRTKATKQVAPLQARKILGVMALLRSRHTVLGLSVCMGLFGVALSWYRHDIKEILGFRFTG